LKLLLFQLLEGHFVISLVTPQVIDTVEGKAYTLVFFRRISEASTEAFPDTFRLPSYVN